jgi:Tfp pilus assembly protein FimV
MDRTQVRSRRKRSSAALLALAVAAGTWIGTAASAGAEDQGRPAPSVRYVVRPGDTLWSIAGRVSPPGQDLRPVVDEIAARNRLGGVLVPGQVLRLPIGT